MSGANGPSGRERRTGAERMARAAESGDVSGVERPRADVPSAGDGRRRLGAGARRVRGEPGRRTGGRGRGRRLPPGSAGRVAGRRLVRRGRLPALHRRHPAARLLDDEGHRRPRRGAVRRAGPARLRRAGRRLLARVRCRRQGPDHRRPAAVAPGRAARDRRRGHPRRGLRLGPHGGPARRAGADLGARDGARLPRRHVRLAGRGAGAPRRSQGPDARWLRGRRADRPRSARRPGSACPPRWRTGCRRS